MDAVVAIVSIITIFWPLTLLFGLRKFLQKNLTLSERFRLGILRVFIGWLIFAIGFALIYSWGKQPAALLPQKLNLNLFILLGILTGGITILWGLHRWRTHRIRLSKLKTLDSLLELSPDEFEKLVATLFKAWGHQAMVLGGTSDHGVDIMILSDKEEKWIVQCKRYNGSVGEPVVRDLYGTMGHEGAQRAYLITTGIFTTGAKDWAVGKPIVLYDGEALVKLIERTQVHRSKLGL